MVYTKGQRVKHPARPDWGVGVVLDIPAEGKVLVNFDAAGFKTLLAESARLVLVQDSVTRRAANISLTLTVPAEQARQLIDQIPHATCSQGAALHWQVAEDGTVQAQSVNWLFCWAKTGMGRPIAAEAARRVFDAIFPITFNQYNALVDHEYARRHRY